MGTPGRPSQTSMPLLGGCEGRRSETLVKGAGAAGRTGATGEGARGLEAAASTLIAGATGAVAGMSSARTVGAGNVSGAKETGAASTAAVAVPTELGGEAAASPDCETSAFLPFADARGAGTSASPATIGSSTGGLEPRCDARGAAGSGVGIATGTSTSIAGPAAPRSDARAPLCDACSPTPLARAAGTLGRAAGCDGRAAGCDGRAAGCDGRAAGCDGRGASTSPNAPRTDARGSGAPSGAASAALACSGFARRLITPAPRRCSTTFLSSSPLRSSLRLMRSTASGSTALIWFFTSEKPSDWNMETTSLLVKPRSRATSYTRTLFIEFPVTALAPSPQRGTAQSRPSPQRRAIRR